jgi:hypothetical protein
MIVFLTNVVLCEGRHDPVSGFSAQGEGMTTGDLGMNDSGDQDLGAGRPDRGTN